MSEPTGRGGVKTLAIRLPDELHAQLVIVASLEDASLTDTIRRRSRSSSSASAPMATWRPKPPRHWRRWSRKRRSASRPCKHCSAQVARPPASKHHQKKHHRAGDGPGAASPRADRSLSHYRWREDDVSFSLQHPTIW